MYNRSYMRSRLYFLQSITIVTLLLCLLNGCNEKDKYYERPEWLDPPIYSQLEKKGNFSSFLACIDKAGYKDVLNRAGYFTVFAPNDDAFAVFLTENALSSVDEIDTLTAQKIVRYAMVYNVFASDKLDDYQSTDLQGWIEDIAFKRKTAYYKWVYDEEVNGEMVKVIDINGAVQIPPGAIYYADDNNNKHIPYFTSNFMTSKNLGAYDYNYFFPQSTLTDFNVVDAKVIEKNVLAENGIIHVIDKVILPLPSLEDCLASNSEYSVFKEVIDKYMKYYEKAPADFLAKFESYAGIKTDVYLKYYPYLNYPLNCENFLKYGGGEEYDAQIDGWTLFAPTNDAVQQFFDTKFLKYYKTLDNMSPEIISEFINAHLFRTTVWPSKFATTTNYYGEEARFDAESDVIEKKFGSNGIFYGVSKIQKTDAFYTILGDIILDPNYSLMMQALLTTELYYVVKNPSIRMTVFMIPNKTFDKLGFEYDAARNTWNLDNPALGTQALFGLNRLLNLHVVLNKEIENLNKMERTFVKTYNDEYIGYGYGSIWASGNSASEIIYPTGKKVTSNGISYVLDTISLKYSIENVGAHIEGKPAFNLYYQYLQKSATTFNGFVYNSTTKAITNISQNDNNTILIPNDAAMQAAVTAGLLPGLQVGWTEVELSKVLNFISYNMVAKVIVINDGEIKGERETWYKTIEGKTYLTVNNEAGSLSFTDRNGRTANADNSPSSYILANRAIILLIDNYLSY
jgi:uncharacterized surface protein with fasciclin (FAS1) repeats